MTEVDQVDTRIRVSPWDYFMLIVEGSQSELNMYFTSLALQDPHPSPYACFLHFRYHGGKAELDTRFRVDPGVPSHRRSLTVQLPLAA